MSMDGQDTKCRRNIAKNYNRLCMVYERYRQTTDGRATAYSEREREFTFANEHPALTHLSSIAPFTFTLLLPAVLCLAAGRALGL